MKQKPTRSGKKTANSANKSSLSTNASRRSTPLRKELDLLISRQIVHHGATHLGLALAFNHHLQQLLVRAAAVQEMDRDALTQLAKRLTTKRSTRRSRRG